MKKGLNPKIFLAIFSTILVTTIIGGTVLVNSESVVSSESIVETISFVGFSGTNQKILDSLLINNNTTNNSTTESQTIADSAEYLKFKQEYEQNTDTVGWINIPGTLIDYPIMYRGDNQYYLNHNSDGMLDSNGAIFLDASCKDNLYVLHGHNMKSGLMFGILDNYKDPKFVKTHSKINIVMNDKVRTFQIYSVVLTEEDKDIFNEDTLKNLIVSNNYFLDSTVEPTNNKLILNTCSYEFSGAHLLIIAYQIK